jgi:hypothetical protein
LCRKLPECPSQVPLNEKISRGFYFLPSQTPSHQTMLRDISFESLLPYTVWYLLYSIHHITFPTWQRYQSSNYFLPLFHWNSIHFSQFNGKLNNYTHLFRLLCCIICSSLSWKLAFMHKHIFFFLLSCLHILIILCQVDLFFLSSLFCSYTFLFTQIFSDFVRFCMYTLYNISHFVLK